MSEPATQLPLFMQDAISVLHGMGVSKKKAASICGCHSCKCEYQNYLDWVKTPAEIQEGGESDGSVAEQQGEA